MRKIYFTWSIAVVCTFFGLFSCDEPEEMTPKVDDVTDYYLIPKGTILTAEDRNEVQEIWKEYNEATN